MDGFGDRLVEAIRFASVTVGQLATASNIPHDKVRSMFGAEWVGHCDALALAGVLAVDCRWLVCGQPAPAFDDARAILDRAGISAVTRGHLLELFKRMPTTPRRLGVCRYCGCTADERAVKCDWVDDARTICAECLEPTEGSDASG